ncbi:MAG: hypothetical protein OEM63_06820 [Gammaproteobacteria bacterium]|nr:hypothetical protein [Gammaproteobacteria bacterium]
MDNPTGKTTVNIEGEVIAILLDQDEYPANVGNVAAISDRQIAYLKRDHDELIGYRLDYLDIGDCVSIEYHQEEAWYRKILAGLFFLAALAVAVSLATGMIPFTNETQALIIVIIALVTFAIRFTTSTHRHYISFEMPDQVLHWRSPAIDFKSKAADAHAVRDYARERGILRAAA